MDLLSTIGNTPLVRLRRSSPNPRVEIWAKLELANPTGSLKDRIAKHMIERAEASGQLRPGMTIVEATSGNTGIALGMVAAVKGYRLELYMLETKTIERRKLLRFWGAELKLTTGADPDSHIWGASQRAADAPDQVFYINQNENPENVRAHELGIGRELVEQTGGRIDAFVTGFGTGGCLMGVASAFQSAGVGAQIVAVEPASSREGIDGLKFGEEAYQPPIYDRTRIHRTIRVRGEDAIATTKAIAKTEGIIAGISSGAQLWAAQRLAEEMDEGRIVVAFCDRGERYFSTAVFE